MKKIVSICLGSSTKDFEIFVSFAGNEFDIKRFGTDGNVEKAAEMLLLWEKTADVIGLGDVKFPYAIGPSWMLNKESETLKKLGSQLKIPVSTGDIFRSVIHEWAISQLQSKGIVSFTDCSFLFISGMINYNIAKSLSPYAKDMMFADTIMENAIPRAMNSLSELEFYAIGMQEVLKWIPTKFISNILPFVYSRNTNLLRELMEKAQWIVLPGYQFYKYVSRCPADAFSGKCIITSTAFEDQLLLLKQKNVKMVIDTTPRIASQLLAVNILEAILIALSDKTPDQITKEDMLSFINAQQMIPQVIYFNN